MQNEKNKINLPKYFLCTLPLTLLLSLAFRLTGKEILGLGIFYVFTLINQAFLLLGLQGLLALAKEDKERRKKTAKVVFFLATKLLFLGAGLVLCVHFMGSKLFIALINYVAQIFILIWCLKR